MSDKIEFTLDGKKVTASGDETIWAVAKREGTKIPHLCHVDLPGYRPDGNCRACMVEIEGERVLAASCIRTPSPGMKVKTQTDMRDMRPGTRTWTKAVLSDQAIERGHYFFVFQKLARSQEIAFGNFAVCLFGAQLDSALIDLLLRDALAGQQLLGSGVVDLGQLFGLGRRLEVGLGLFKLLIGFGRIDDGQHITGFDTGADVGVPLLEVAIDARVNRGRGESL